MSHKHDRTKLKKMELAIANYNAMIRTLKRRMKRGTAYPLPTRQAIARFQQARDDLEVQLGLERI